MLKIEKLETAGKALWKSTSVHQVTTREAQCIIYENEAGNLVIRADASMQITHLQDGIEITLI